MILPHCYPSAVPMTSQLADFTKLWQAIPAYPDSMNAIVEEIDRSPTDTERFSSCTTLIANGFAAD